MNIRQRRS